MRIQKTLSASVISAFFALPALFAATSASAGSFDGAYVNGFIGGLNSNLTIDQSPSVTVPNQNQNNGLRIRTTTENTAFVNSVFGGVGVGFNKVFMCRYLIGVEGVADWEDIKLNKNSYVNELQSGFFLTSDPGIRLKNTFALLFTPGLVLDPNTLVYGVVGPRWGRFETSLTTTNTIPSDGQARPGASVTSGTKSAYSPGITLGAGISRYVTPHLSIGAEYQFTHYNNISSPNDINATFPADPRVPGLTGTLTNSVGYKANTNTLMVNLCYHFS